MTTLTKCAGLLAGVSTAAAIGVAIAQGNPPNPRITNPAIGAGQQSTHGTPMGETGVLWGPNEVRTATITREPEVAAVQPAPAPAPAPVAEAPAPAPAPVAEAPAPTPAPAPVAQAPASEPSPVAMGASRADRN